MWRQNDCDRNARDAKLSEKLDDSIIGNRFLLAVAGVMDTECAVGFFELGVVHPVWNTALDQLHDAVSDKLPDLFFCPYRHTAGFHRGIYTGGQVIQRVQQGSVKIKYNRMIFQHIGVILSARSQFSFLVTRWRVPSGSTITVDSN